METGTAGGEVDRGEIGGEGLQVLSVWDENRDVSTEGSFEVRVSTEGAQLLVVQDSSGDARGLAISLPGSGADSLLFDARSTALALLMMTPGILSVDPAEASARLSAIEALEEFQLLVSLLEASLASRTLREAVETQAIRTAMETCVRSWVVQDTTAYRIPLSTQCGLTATIEDASDLRNTRIMLANAAWRFVSVHRRDLNIEGAQERIVAVDANQLPTLTSMGGATAVGWGSLFARRIGDPTTVDDATDFLLEGGIGRVDYWFQGLGFAAGGAEIPADIPPAWEEPTTLSIVWYLVFPIIDLYFGAVRLLGASSEVLRGAYDVVKNAVSLSDLAQAENIAEIADCALDVTVAALGAIAAAGAASGAAGLWGISAPVWLALGIALAVVAGGFAVANMLIAADSWAGVPASCMLTVHNPSGTGSLLAYWDFNQGAGTIAEDASGRSHHGNIIGASWGPGINGSALEFDGEDDYVTVQGGTWLTQSAGTVEAWVKIDSAACGGRIVSTETGGWHNGLHIGYVTMTGPDVPLHGAILGGIHSTEGSDHYAEVYIDDVSKNEWHFVAFTWDADSDGLLVFVDGETSIASSSHPGIQDTGEPLTIGCYQSSNTRGGWFKGWVDEVRIYDRVLSTDELNTHYGSMLDCTAEAWCNEY